MSKRVLVIGGDAAGMSAASTVKRSLRDEVEVIVLEKGQYTSYAACGLPFWISGEIPERDDLIARSPEAHRKNGIDVRLGVEATAIDPATNTVSTAGGEEFGYDHLVIATGAEPTRPPLENIDSAGIHEVHTIPQGQAILDGIAKGVKKVVIVGSGYIGLEMAEATHALGLETTVLEMQETPMPILTPDMGEQIATAMEDAGVEFVGGCAVTGFATENGHVTSVLTRDGEYPADLVLLGLGVKARSKLASDAGMPTGPGRGILVDDFGRVEGQENIWAAGDCVASEHRLTDEKVHLALGTHANKQGLVVGRSLTSVLKGQEPEISFPGVLGTAITRFNTTEIALSGLNEDQAREAGFDPVVAKIETTTAAHYHPKSEPMTIRFVADRRSRRLLGAQIVGGNMAGARIDTIAMALWVEMTVDELAMTDLSYAPPFSPVWDPVQMAARAAIRAVDMPAS